MSLGTASLSPSEDLSAAVNKTVSLSTLDEALFCRFSDNSSLAQTTSGSSGGASFLTTPSESLANGATYASLTPADDFPFLESPSGCTGPLLPSCSSRTGLSVESAGEWTPADADVLPFQSPEGPLRDVAKDVAGMTPEALHCYAVQMGTRAQIFDRENRELRRQLVRQERKYVKSVARRHQGFVARHCLLLDKLRVLRMQMEAERNTRQEFEQDARQLRSVHDSLEERVRESLDERDRAVERALESQHCAKQLQLKVDTLQQLNAHLSEEFERQNGNCVLGQ